MEGADFSVAMEKMRCVFEKRWNTLQDLKRDHFRDFISGDWQGNPSNNVDRKLFVLKTDVVDLMEQDVNLWKQLSLLYHVLMEIKQDYLITHSTRSPAMAAMSRSCDDILSSAIGSSDHTLSDYLEDPPFTTLLHHSHISRSLPNILMEEPAGDIPSPYQESALCLYNSFGRGDGQFQDYCQQRSSTENCSNSSNVCPAADAIEHGCVQEEEEDLVCHYSKNPVEMPDENKFDSNAKEDRNFLESTIDGHIVKTSRRKLRHKKKRRCYVKSSRGQRSHKMHGFKRQQLYPGIEHKGRRAFISASISKHKEYPKKHTQFNETFICDADPCFGSSEKEETPNEDSSSTFLKHHVYENTIIVCFNSDLILEDSTNPSDAEGNEEETDCSESDEAVIENTQIISYLNTEDVADNKSRTNNVENDVNTSHHLDDHSVDDSNIRMYSDVQVGSGRDVKESECVSLSSRYVVFEKCWRRCSNRESTECRSQVTEFQTIKPASACFPDDPKMALKYRLLQSDNKVVETSDLSLPRKKKVVRNSARMKSIDSGYGEDEDKSLELQTDVIYQSQTRNCF